jgi:hypothetical protein
MTTSLHRAPMTVEQLRERLAAEEKLPSVQRSRPTGWLWLIAASTIALGATASLVLHGVA